MRPCVVGNMARALNPQWLRHSAAELKALKRFLIWTHDPCALGGRQRCRKQIDDMGLSSEWDESMLEWTKQALGETTASLGPPAAKLGRGVGVHLLDVIADPPVHAQSGNHRRFSLKYLITARADHPARARKMLRRLLSAATQNPELEVELQMPSVNFWRVHGLPPQPCMVLRKRAWKRRAPVTTKLVRKSAVRRVMFRSLEGVVYGPQGAPLADALIHLPSINRSTRTGQHGEFNFETVPATAVQELLVEARGREMRIDLTDIAMPWPLAIHFRFEQ